MKKLKKIIFFTHPEFFGSWSMPRFTKMLEKGFKQKQYHVETWQPQARFFNFACFTPLKKWGGYMDQYFVFPSELRKKIKQEDSNTLFVFSDQGLGPWIPLVQNRPHVVHCHDLIAQQTALGEYPNISMGLFSKIYQKYIRQGLRKGKAFISVSKATQRDLHKILGGSPPHSEVIHNGLNHDFRSINKTEAWSNVPTDIKVRLSGGFILHVGGNQWYKNREGVVLAFQKYVSLTENPLPLVLIGRKPSPGLEALIKKSSARNHILILVDVDFNQLRAFYNLASFLFFPSITEGFGWPIIEAMACGCRVLTVDKEPMKEVGGEVAFYCPPPDGFQSIETWAEKAAQKVLELAQASEIEKRFQKKSSLDRSTHFLTEKALNSYESFYKFVFNELS